MEAANHRFMFPAGVIEQRHGIAHGQAQHAAQMLQFLTGDGRAGRLDILFADEESSHRLLAPLEQQGHPLAQRPLPARTPGA